MLTTPAEAVPDVDLSRYRRAADFAAAQIYLRDNVMLESPLRPEHVKPRLLGHWGTCPGITFMYAGLNRLTATPTPAFYSRRVRAMVPRRTWRISGLKGLWPRWTRG